MKISIKISSQMNFFTVYLGGKPTLTTMPHLRGKITLFKRSHLCLIMHTFKFSGSDNKKEKKKRTSNLRRETNKEKEAIYVPELSFFNVCEREYVSECVCEGERQRERERDSV